ncbi:MAG: site-specific DNA-methyltransferase, partial [Chloroflexi bacterium]|nr:site-specific DNA-methyltransferase [Chloroflexota bacterium]
MAGQRRTPRRKRPIESYDHRDKDRLNNPPVGLVTPETDKDGGRTTYAYDPHLDPELQWAGKAEHTSFEVPTVSLHVHERIDPRTIIEATRRRNGDESAIQPLLFEMPEENPPIRNAIEFYQHRHNWTNRLVAGDSLLVMNSLLEKEGMAGKVQMVYIDPPYGIRYGSNFQPFVNRRDVRDGRDEDLTQEPETIRAFRDTWELGIHSYLSYLRDRLLLARDMLVESGSCFVQISDENVHRVRCLMDEVFGDENFVSLISYATTSGLGNRNLETAGDYIIWYARDKQRVKTRNLWIEKEMQPDSAYRFLVLRSGERRPLTSEEREGKQALPPGSSIFRYDNVTSPRPAGSGDVKEFEFEGRKFRPGNGTFKSDLQGLDTLKQANRLGVVGNTLSYVRHLTDFPCKRISNIWADTTIAGFASNKRYAVETSNKVIQRCMLMTTDPGDLVFDPTCGSGTTAYVAEQWGRRWITCDTSRVAVTLAKQRLMTAAYDYYELAHSDEGVGSGFKYKTVPHITLGSITNNPDIRKGMSQAEVDAAIARHAPQETLYDQPVIDRGKKRVTGPFSVEAVPAPAVKSIDESAAPAPTPADASVGRSGETLRQGDWRDELLKTGIRGKAGQFIRFSRLEPLPGCRWLHADGESLLNDEGAEGFRDVGAAYDPQRVVVSFGPDHAPIEQRQVNQALQEAETLRPQPRVIVFAAFQFDPEAAKDIDETNWPSVTLLKAQMNADLLTEDLKRKRASNESFWL